MWMRDHMQFQFVTSLLESINLIQYIVFRYPLTRGIAHGTRTNGAVVVVAVAFFVASGHIS